jgi:hypothetical protein
MKVIKSAFLLILAMFMLTFCTDKPENQTMEPYFDEPDYLTIETISQEYMGYPLMIEEPMLKVIRTREELDKLWQLPSSRIEKSDAPDIDFDTQMLIVAAMGEQPSSGYSIEITGAEKKDDVWVVSVKETSPGPSCIGLMVLTTPHHLAVIPKSSSEITFQVAQVIEDCE